MRKIKRTLEPRSFGGGYEKKELRDEWVVIWPKVRNTCSNEQIPSEIRNDLNNVLSILDITPDAAASLARRALERTLRKYLNLKGRFHLLYPTKREFWNGNSPTKEDLDFLANFLKNTKPLN